MSQVLEQMAVLVVLYIMLKQSFAFFLPFVLRYKSMCKINEVEFSIQYLLSLPAITILCLCDSFFSLFLLLTIPNPHAPSLECTNLLWLVSWQKSPQKDCSQHPGPDAELHRRWRFWIRVVVWSMSPCHQPSVPLSSELLWPPATVFPSTARVPMGSGREPNPISPNRYPKPTGLRTYVLPLDAL